MTVGAYALDPLRDARHRDARAARDLADWLAWLELGNKAARTLDSYERYCAGLLRAWPDTAFADFDDGHLLHVLKEHPPRSRHIVKAAWNNWFRWGYKIARRIPANPVDLLPQMTYKPSRVYDVFSEAETDAFCALSSPDGHLCTILFWTGIRLSEARLLTGKRLNLARRDLIVVEGAKGGKHRVVPMSDQVAAAAAELLTLEGIGPDDFLWGSKPGGSRLTHRATPVAQETFYRWWRACSERAGVRYRKVHMVRHTFATRLYELGMDDLEVQRLLGHESSQTTRETYIHINDAAVSDKFRALVGGVA